MWACKPAEWVCVVFILASPLLHPHLPVGPSADHEWRHPESFAFHGCLFDRRNSIKSYDYRSMNGSLVTCRFPDAPWTRAQPNQPAGPGGVVGDRRRTPSCAIQYRAERSPPLVRRVRSNKPGGPSSRCFSCCHVHGVPHAPATSLILSPKRVRVRYSARPLTCSQQLALHRTVLARPLVRQRPHASL